jgi:hypothetical protein
MTAEAVVVAQEETALQTRAQPLQPGQTGLDNLLLEALLFKQAIHLLQIMVYMETAVMEAECLPLTEAAALES